jgi:hypothetical protein
MSDAALTGTPSRLRPTADGLQRVAHPPRSASRARLEALHDRRQRAEDKAADDWYALRGKKCRVDHLPTLAAFLLWLEGCVRAEGREFQRSKAQIIRGMARHLDGRWRLTGTVRGDERRYAMYVRRRLEDAVELGWVEPIDGRAWKTLWKDDGSSPGILIRVPAGVAQSVAATLSPRLGGPRRERPPTPSRPGADHRPAARRARKSGEVCYPSRRTPASEVVLDPPTRAQTRGAEPGRTRSQGSACGRPNYPGRRDTSGPLADPNLGAALKRCRELGIEGGVPALVAAVEAGENPLAASVVAWEVLRRGTGESVDVRLHPLRWRQLSRALVRAQAYGSGGSAGAGFAVDVLVAEMEASAREGWAPRPIIARSRKRTRAIAARHAGTTVQSLAHFGCLLDRLSKRWRRELREAAA